MHAQDSIPKHERGVLSGQEYCMFGDVEYAVRDVYAGYARGSYPYIRLDQGSFEQRMKHLLLRKKGLHVVDVGCGAGDKLLTMHRWNPSLRITGIEHCHLTAVFAQFVCPFAKIIEADALELDYSEYDVIYMYRPIANYDLMTVLQHRVMATMKTGAVYVCVSQNYADWSTSIPFPSLGSWVKP